MPEDLTPGQQIAINQLVTTMRWNAATLMIGGIFWAITGSGWTFVGTIAGLVGYSIFAVWRASRAYKEELP